MLLEVAGRRVFAATGGRAFDASLPAVALLHGAGMDHTVWSLQSRYLAHHGRSVLALDLPGHGRSAGPPLESIGDLAGWTLACVGAVGLDRAAIVGHSMGGLVALDCAVRAPSLVSRLALLGVAARMPVHPELLAAAREDRALARELVSSWSHGRPGHFGGNPAPGLWMMEGALTLLERAASGVLAVDLAACDAYDAAAVAPQVACPTVVLCGIEDRMTPAAGAQALAGSIPGARFVPIPQAGHMLTIEQPNAVIDVLGQAL